MELSIFALLILTFIAAPAVAQDGPDLTPVDQQISDEAVLQLVDTAYPGLEEFAASMKTGDFEAARGHLISHFANREKPVIPVANFPGISEGNSMIKLRSTSPEMADKWLTHTFTLSNNDIGRPETYSLGDEIQWMENPSEALSWILYLNQLNVVNGLAAIYQQTGDEKYALEAGTMVKTWTEQCYRGYGYTRNGELVSSGMEVRNRLCNTLMAYDVLRKSPSLTPEMHMAFYKLFIACCRELLTYSGVSYPGLIPCAVLYPEFTESAEWLAGGEVDLRHALIDRTTPEGAWDTHSISYQTVPVPWAMRSLEFLEANPESGDFTELAGVIRQQTGKLLRMMLWCMMPNGGLPNIGDTYGRSDWHTTAGGHAASYIYSQLTPEQQERLNANDSIYQRVLAALAIYEGHDEAVPHTTSIGHPGSGYYIMRKSWEPDDTPYMYFDLTPQKLGHAHWDACHFDLYAYGKPLLCDTGDYFLGWGYRTGLHNTIEIDEASQAWGAEMMPCDWITTPSFDFVDGANAGYVEQSVLHRRKMLFAKDLSGRFADYWILSDLLTGEGAHKAEQFFHFAGPSQELGATADMAPSTLAAISTNPDVANIQVIPAHTDGMDAGFVEAKDTDMLPADKFGRDAMLGWIVTTGTHQRAKSAVAVYTREGEMPAAFYDVLFPTQAGADADIKVSELPVTADGISVASTVAAGLEIRCSVSRPTHAPGDIQIDHGENLALGMPAFAEINQNSMPAGPQAKLTDGNPGPTEIAAAISSTPYTPNVQLEGNFTIDFGQPREVNMLVAHHGTFNGSGIIYPPSEFTIQYLAGDQWRDVSNPVTTWLPDTATSTSFDPITATRLRIHVIRNAGGRLAMREIEAYRISQAELDRIEALKAEVTTTEWTDYCLISHDGAIERTYGDFTFNGELAFLRKDADGNFVQLFLTNASSLHEGALGEFTAPAHIPYLTATASGNGILVESPAFATGSTQLDATSLRDGHWQVALPTQRAPQARITDAAFELHPPQEYLAGGQPWATVRWQTDVPATTQVEYVTDDGLIRRTPLDTRRTTDHSVRVEFLRADRTYTFTALSTSCTWPIARFEIPPKGAEQ